MCQKCEKGKQEVGELYRETISILAKSPLYYGAVWDNYIVGVGESFLNAYYHSPSKVPHLVGQTGLLYILPSYLHSIDNLNLMLFIDKFEKIIKSLENS